MKDSLRIGYHSQEKRGIQLIGPVICKRLNAWLGNGYYFWDDKIDAINWGNNAKTKTKKFEIYKADIDTENFLNTVFDEDHYKFWLRIIESVAKKFHKQNNKKPEISHINLYLEENGYWKENNIQGIIFQDISENPNQTMVKSLYYKKRIQIVVFNLDKISNFALDSIHNI